MSASHSNRLVVTYVYPPKAAAIYRANAKLVRTNKSAGFSDYPVGTLIAKESFERGADGAPDRRGPVFFMRKEKAGYDPSGENWRYAFTQADFSLIGEGVKDNVEFCKACHAAVRARHFVYAQDR
ncbi:MAG: cytochrome P460 family protein [Candidatus Lambdaproteobacteria bacterium]|nr:cytochrome P460 family protein [Candidatus Lambdaproteobacteria bacterium]